MSRLRATLSGFGLPDASFIQRSIPCVISACYDQWKAAYAASKQIQQYFLVLDFGFTGSSVYLVGVKHVGDRASSLLEPPQDQVSSPLVRRQCPGVTARRRGRHSQGGGGPRALAAAGGAGGGGATGRAVFAGVFQRGWVRGRR